jgi:predicted TIM-barrel fold metal-dependent hydrolase
MLEDAMKLVDQCPATRFILDHCGNADVKVFQAAASKNSSEAAIRQVHQWRRGIAKAAERKNLVCKISGIIASVPKEGWSTGDLAPIINHCLDCFGPDRVMFGGDWPICTRATPLRRWVEVLLEIVRSRSYLEQTKLFAQNACRFYGLGRPGAGQKR